MKNYSIFDIIGPIMIGPSSSHTAGAARLAKVASVIAGGKIKKVDFYLHGSFAKTYKGHGTDKALVAGILGMEPWDDRLKTSFEIAKEKNIELNFHEVDLGDVHPNTVKFAITKENGNTSSITGSSIGGGNIIIFNVDGQEVDFKGDYPTLITKHKDIPGIVSKITTLLYNENINIGTIKLYRNSRGLEATMALETDEILSQPIVDKIKAIPEIISIKIINPIKEGEV
ncbi:L-serine ammonia-lyase, iron-sulfur-dependent subunit beta [Clostridium malenominatum]|uniref:L-serine deaminase n=1 Tax=Clostridium malenominatum TaxID=1539 RepID=A0ABP3UAG9_9CLOT